MRRLAAASLAAALLAGCGSGSSTTVISNNTVTQTVTTDTTPGGTAASTPVSHLTFFSSPSGNIGCAMSSRSARCDIKDRSWKPPASGGEATACPLDYGQGLTVSGATKARFVCAGDTTLGANKVLPYGTSSQVGVFLCTSETTSMKCGNTDTGHGFELSREGYKLF